MIKAGRVFRGLFFSPTLCISAYVQGCFFQMCWRQLLYEHCSGGGRGILCLYICMCQVLIPSSFFLPSSRSGTCWQAGIRWAGGPIPVADLSASAESSGRASQSRTHTGLMKKSSNCNKGDWLDYNMNHSQDMKQSRQLIMSWDSAGKDTCC